MTTPQLLEDLRRDEGFRARAYQDDRGVWTVGFGHAHCDPRTVWTRDEAETQLAVDVDLACERLDRALPWWRALDDVRQDALANMAFNMGVGEPPCSTHAGTGLQSFGRMLAALEAGDYTHASAQMLISHWAKEPPEGVGERAERLAAMIRTGERPHAASPAAASQSPALSTHPGIHPMTDTLLPPASAPAAGPIQRATLDMARSLLMSAGTPLLAHGYVTGNQEQAIVGGVLAVGSAVWSYVAAHPSKTNPLQSVLGLVRKGGQAQAWDGDVSALERALLPVVERVVDAQIRARAGILAGPLDAAANAALAHAAGEADSHLKI